MGRRGDDGGPYLARVQQYARHPTIRLAGLVGSEFGLDPVLVIDERDAFRFAIRAAAFVAVQNDRAEADRLAAERNRG